MANTYITLDKSGQKEPLVKHLKTTQTRRRKHNSVCRNIRICLIILLLGLLLSLAYFLLLRPPIRAPNEPHKSPKAVKTILLWNEFDGDERWGLPEDTVFSNFTRDTLGCGVWQCIITGDRHYEAGGLTGFDAILYNEEGSYPQDIMDKNTTQYQIFIGKHPATEVPRGYSQVHFYNTTMVYRQNAKIIAQNYELFINATFDKSLQSNDSISSLKSERKSSFALFIVDPPCRYKCQYQNGLLADFKSYIDVDVQCSPISNHTFAYHKFYITFEESLAENYLSSNFYRAIENGVVPVVMTNNSYTRFLPSGISINAGNFPTLSALVDYMVELDKNPHEYEKYIRAAYRYLVRPTASIFCSVCGFINNHKELPLELHNVRLPEIWWKVPGCRNDRLFQH